MNCWLFKSEESVFSIKDLAREPGKTACWEGVRNYQARNFLRDDVKKGDELFFYHSNCAVPGIAGIAAVVKEGYPDHYAWDGSSKYFDARSTPEKPVWFMVDIKLEKSFRRVISLSELRENPALKDMKILQKGNRLSVTPVARGEWEAVLRMEKLAGG
jgi:predicted RNA-binding protein with PUA-like domain